MDILYHAYVILGREGELDCTNPRLVMGMLYGVFLGVTDHPRKERPSKATPSPPPDTHLPPPSTETGSALGDGRAISPLIMGLLGPPERDPTEEKGDLPLPLAQGQDLDLDQLRQEPWVGWVNCFHTGAEEALRTRG